MTTATLTAAATPVTAPAVVARVLMLAPAVAPTPRVTTGPTGRVISSSSSSLHLVMVVVQLMTHLSLLSLLSLLLVLLPLTAMQQQHHLLLST